MPTMRVRRPTSPMPAIAVLCTLATLGQARAAELLVGGATISITPDRPVALAGQMHTRIAKDVRSPVTATAMAFESKGGKAPDQAILVSCDLVFVDQAVIDRVRTLIKGRLPDFTPEKLVLSATHTHTAPVQEEGNYLIPKDGVIMQPAEYAEFLSERIARAVVDAWTSRRPGRVGWGLGHAVVAQNRRAVYADGRAVMYGVTDKADFRGIEGPEDHGVEVLFVWDGGGKLIATAVNVACPSQEVEGESAVDADFWHEVRESLRAKHGKDLLVLGWTGAAGDQSPHLMYRKPAEERMRRLRKLTRLEELARRIVAAWEEAHEGARQEQVADAELTHRVETIELPARPVTDAELAATRKEIESFSKDPRDRRMVTWHRDVVDRHERQKAGTAGPYKMELHVIRLGDVAIATNPFELFTQYGIQIKARSPALQTFVVQLAGPGSYLPTEVAVKGGGYSAIVASSVVGPEGGRVLVDRTVGLIDSLWPKK